MRRKLLEILRDPESGEPLELDAARDPVETGTLRSPSGRSWQVRGGVPRFVDDPYAASFALQWNRFGKVQLDSENGSTASRDRFLREVPWAAEIEGRWVVDAGCGAGRFAEIAADLGAEVLAVDLSAAVDATQRNLGHRPNVHVLQADLRELPVDHAAIEHLYCIGVLQHTPDPLLSARQLVQLLAPGGRFAFTIYGRKPWTRLYAKYLVRPVTRRIPPARLLHLIERAMPVVFPVTERLFALPFLGRIFRFVIPVANYVERTDLPRETRYEEAILDTFDMLSPRYDRPVTADEVVAAVAPLCEEVTVVSTAPLVVAGRRLA